MNFQDFDFRKDYLTDTTSFTYRNIVGVDCEIQVKKYLPIEDKLDLIAITLQKAEENGIYNELLIEMFFNLNIVYLYTNIEFNDEDREDEFALYDILESNGIFDNVISMIEDDYKVLKEMLSSMQFANMEYQNTAAAVLRRIITDLPANAAAAKEIVDSFNPSQYQEVLNFATAANGGRNINTQMAPVSPAADEVKETSPTLRRKIIETK